MIAVVGVVVLGLSLHYSFHSTGDSEVFCCGRDGWRGMCGGTRCVFAL